MKFEKVTSIKEVVSNMVVRGFDFEMFKDPYGEYYFHSFLGNREFVISAEDTEGLKNFWNEVLEFWV